MLKALLPVIVIVAFVAALRYWLWRNAKARELLPTKSYRAEGLFQDIENLNRRIEATRLANATNRIIPPLPTVREQLARDAEIERMLNEMSNGIQRSLTPIDNSDLLALLEQAKNKPAPEKVMPKTRFERDPLV